MTDREVMIAKAEALLDDLIDSDPDKAERFIESQLARLALKKRASDQAKQAEPVAIYDGVGFITPHGDPVPIGPLYATPPDDEAVRLLRADAARLDALEAATHRGLCPAVVFDDDGRWAVSDAGSQPVPLGDDGFKETVSLVSVVEPDEWRRTLREAIDAYLAKVGK